MHPRKVLSARLAEEYGGNGDAVVLAAPVSDQEWANIDDTVARVLTSDQSAIQRVLGQIVRGRRTYVLPRRRTRESGGTRRGPGERADAVKALLSRYLTSQDDPLGVMAFRREVLGNRLLTPRMLSSWVSGQSSTGGSSRLLAYRVPTSEWTQYVAASTGSDLDRLRATSERVAKFTGWAPAHATVFVLTGMVDPASAIQATARYEPRMSVRSRIVLTVDPSSTPAEVADAYRRFRRSNFGRVRRLSTKHTALAKFVIEHSDLSARDQLVAWNASRRQGKYREVSAFTRAAEHAVRRLTDPFRPPRIG